MKYNKLFISLITLCLVGCNNSIPPSPPDPPINPREPILVSDDDLEFKLSDDESGYYITFYKKYEKYIKLPDFYNDKPVVGISNYAFRSSGGVKDIHLPMYIEDLTGLSFYDCTTLENIILDYDNDDYATIDGVLYSNDGTILICCPSACSETFIVKDSVTDIAPYAFAGNKKAKYITLSDNVSYIGEKAFSRSKSLINVTYSSALTYISEYCFEYCPALTEIKNWDNVTEIQNSAFFECHGLKNVVISESVITIKEHAYESCTELKSVTFNENIETVGSFAFAYDSKLGTIDFSSCQNLKTIKDFAFMQNFTLTSLDLPEGLTSIENAAFFYTTRLKYVNLPSSLETIGDQVFLSSDSAIVSYSVSEDSNYFATKDGALYSKDFKTLYVYPARSGRTEAVIDDRVEVIKTRAFYDCITLQTITLSSSLKEIGVISFYICTSLNKIIYPGTMEEFTAIKKPSLTENNITYSWDDTYNGNLNTVQCSDGNITIN